MNLERALDLQRQNSITRHIKNIFLTLVHELFYIKKINFNENNLVLTQEAHNVRANIFLLLLKKHSSISSSDT
ncbi:hypothetical protein ACJX0J_030613, partial [Zea mays]